MKRDVRRSWLPLRPAFLLVPAMIWGGVMSPFTSVEHARKTLLPDEGTAFGAALSDREADSLALVDLYNTTDAINWHNRTNWLRGPMGSWFGITVANGRVTRIELASNGLSSRQRPSGLPPSLGNLTELRVLDVQNNELRGGVPDAIVGLTHLERLYVNGNGLFELPDLSGMPALVDVRVENNAFTFEDLEPNVGTSFAFTYAPQGLLPVSPLPVFAYDSTRVTLHIPVGGEHNRYQWYLDDVPIAGAHADRYTIENPSYTNIGPYVLEVTNTVATELTLWSGRKYVTYVPQFEYKWLDIGAYQQVYSATGALGWTGVSENGMQYPAILRHSGHKDGGWILGGRQGLDGSEWAGVPLFRHAYGTPFGFREERQGGQLSAPEYTHRAVSGHGCRGERRRLVRQTGRARRRGPDPRGRPDGAHHL
ncbi:MAG: hypothetical protein R2834_24720 [Rhodothermales bacterium]